MSPRGLGLLWLYWLLTALAVGHASAELQHSPSEKSQQQANSESGPGLHLVRVLTIATSPPQLVSGFLAPLKCDGDGSLYFRQDGLDAVHKLNPKGQQVALFQAAANTDKKIDGVAAFALASDGDLYQVVFPPEFDRYLFVYKSDGTFKSAIKLNPGFVWSPHALAVFPSGNLLITGSEYDRDRKAAMWPFTGIFAPDGSLLKEIKLEDDETLHDMAASGDARVTLPQDTHANLAISHTQVETASDGNGYLMRWTNPTIIYGISPGGEVVRRVKVDPGEAGYRPAAMHVYQNRIAVLFVNAQTRAKVMKIVDLEGHALATYDEPVANGKTPGAMLGSSFACYTENPTRFVFFGADDDDRLQLWIAQPR